MEREEIREVLRAFYDPRDPDSPGDRYLWLASPVDAVSKVVTRKKLKWTNDEVQAVGIMLAHQSSDSTIELMQNILEAEEMIWDAIKTIRPAYWSTLIMHNVTFYIGVLLIGASVYAAYGGRELFSAVLGGVGLSTVLLLFFLQPVRGVQRSIGTLIQLEIIYNSYTKQIGYWKAYARSMDVEIKSEVIRELKKCTRRTLALIQKYCERLESPKLGDEDV